MNSKVMPDIKRSVSVSEMAVRLDLSRARFYQLLQEGIFPQPIYSIRTRRPFYDCDLQSKCITVRETGIGDNGESILFYRPRQKPTKRRQKQDTRCQELLEILIGMGLQCSAKEVSEAISELYPEGLKEHDQGVVIRDLFRYLKSK